MGRSEREREEKHLTDGARLLSGALLGVKHINETADEFEVDTTPNARQPILILMLMRQAIMRYLNDGKNGVPHGLKERFSGPMTAAVKKCSKSFDFIDQVLSTKR